MFTLMYYGFYEINSLFFPGRVVRFAEGDGGGAKGKKKEGLTPLQAMMLRMAGKRSTK